MIRRILPYGHPALRKPALAADFRSPELASIIEDLWETMANANGAGLAAPQVGISLRIFVAVAPEHQFSEVFINPEILSTGKEITWELEGCLSIPGLSGMVPRSRTIFVRFWDGKGRMHERTFENETARVIQHETDHLDGILYTDRMRPLSRKLLSRRLSDILNGKYSAPYPMARQ